MAAAAPTSWPPSLWADATPTIDICPSLSGTVQADVVVIGAGFTGLSAALELRRAGLDVVVLEAVQPGWGASGRNNGQIIPTLSRPDPEAIVARHGAAGERFVALLRDSAAQLFDLIRQENIAAEGEQTGWIQPVHTPGRMRIAETRVRQWSAVGAAVELLSRDQVQAMTGSDHWYGGFWNRDGGHVNPLALARGLATAAQARGARIYGHSPVQALVREGAQWVARTGAGSVRARGLILATNAYTGEFHRQLAPHVAGEVIPVSLWMLATQPVPEAVRAQVIPARQAVSDTHGDLYFARYDARHRLVSGGLLINPLDAEARLRTHVGERLRGLWPQLGPVRFDYVWQGKVGMTTDFLPRIHTLGPDAYAWAGCNGRAVALSVSLGRELARAVSGVPVHTLALPLSAPAPIPAHGLLSRLAPLMLHVYRRRDARELH